MPTPASILHACRITLPVLVFFLILSVPSKAAPDEAKRVLILHSYHYGFSWTDSVQKGIESTFRDRSARLNLSVEFMDAKLFPDELLFPALQELYETKYARHRPDLILSCDDDALAFLFRYRDRIFPGVPVVFCGLNVDDYDPALIEGRAGYTGVVERLDLSSTIDLILEMQPDVENIAFIHDRTTSGLADRNTIQSFFPRYAARVRFVFPDEGNGLTGQELLSYLRGLDKKTAVYFLGFFRDRLQTPLPLDDIIPRISEASPVPVYSHADAFLGYGILGGKLLSGEVHGKSTAAKALRLLRGTPLSQVPVSVESSNRYLFDDRQLKRFAVSRSRLPADSIILYEPTSFLEKHRTAVLWGIGGAAALVLFTALLLADTVRRQQAEKRLAASERKYRLLADHAADVIWTMDEQYRYTYFSPSVERMLGYSPEELLDIPFEKRLTPESLTIVRQAIQEYQQNWQSGSTARQPKRLELEQVRKDGTVFWTEVVTNPILDEAGGNAGIIGVTRDISERKRHEEERLRMERYLQSSRRLQSLGIMAGGIAHDFNNILMVVLGHMEMAREELPETGSARYHLEQSESAVQRAVDIVRQMLAYSGSGQFVVRPLDIGKVLREFTGQFQPTTAPCVSLKLQTESGLPPMQGDEAQLRQLFLNLTLNAVESFDSDTGGTIRITAGETICDETFLAETFPDVWMGYDRPFQENRFIFIEFKDDGCGMEPDIRKRIFEPFYTTKFQGRGLGLAAVLGIVRGHNGYIHIDSEPDRGTAIRVLFPAVTEKPVAVETDTAAALPEVPEGRGAILLVDDEEQVRLLVRCMLERLGYRVIPASGGAEAIDIFNKRETDIDLVLLDLTMPGMSGVAVFETLREMKKNVPVILSSGYSRDELQSRYRSKGFAGFIQKPYRVNELGHLIRKHVVSGDHSTSVVPLVPG